MVLLFFYREKRCAVYQYKSFGNDARVTGTDNFGAA